MQTDEKARIPVPSDFPFEWRHPEDAARLWERELMHMPKQTTVLEDELIQLWAGGGFNHACEAFSVPVRNAYRRINTYEYQSIAPISHDPAELERIAATMEGLLPGVLESQSARWENEFLPEIRRSLDAWERFDRRGASAAAFRAHLDETIERSTRAWQIHFLVAMPVILSMSFFHDLYVELFGSGGDLAPYRLLQGLDNLSVEADRALWALGRQAAGSSQVRAALEADASTQALAALEATPEGRDFLGALGAFLDRYGRRQDGYVTVTEPSWLEDPAVVLTTVVRYANGDPRDLDAEFAELVAERERLVSEARARLADSPEALGRFEFMLTAARAGSVLQENHNFWIDGQVVFSVRRVMLEAGRRLAASGIVDTAEDVFQLTLDELRGALAGEHADLRSEVAGRTAELDRFSAVQAPPVLGTLPPGPPPNDPVTRAVLRMFGAPPQASESSREVVGMPGSPGTVTARARVLRSLDEAGSLAPGEVLVAPTTSPPWTPLFQIAAAVVTDVGGVLSHCAVVAREYKIPAVVATHVATASIADGDLVEVDGDAGVVRIVAPA